jgi:hypothetical protein
MSMSISTRVRPNQSSRNPGDEKNIWREIEFLQRMEDARELYMESNSQTISNIP